MSLQSRGREKYLRSLKNRDKRKALKDSLKLEELKALDKTSKHTRESGIKRVARKKQIEKRLDKKPVVKKPVVKKVIKKTKPTDPNRGNKVPGIHSTEYLTTTPRPDFNATKVKKADREKGLLTDKTIRNRAKKDSRSTMQKLFGASEEKRAMGRNQMNRARSSMGMKKGGMVKKCKMDGIAIRGKTRAKERSK